jgi:hypothetical protein
MTRAEAYERGMARLCAERGFPILARHHLLLADIIAEESVPEQARRSRRAAA